MTEIRYIDGVLTGKTYKPGMEFKFNLAVPCVEDYEFGYIIEHDWQNQATVNAHLRLADEGKAPYCVSFGVQPGVLTMPGGSKRNMRMNNYDLFDREYGDFLVYELIPYVSETYGIRFSPSPDMHVVAGGSSGGISAFVIAWFHPDVFHRIYMSSPSFLSMGRGSEIPYLVRKYETKPFRIYQEHSETEPNEYFGWTVGIDMEAIEGFKFANYDFQNAYFPGEGHCSRYRDENEAYKRFEWLWAGWQDGPVSAKANSARVNEVIPFGSKWEACDFFPETECDAPEELLEAYDKVVLSNDQEAWYAANTNEDVVHMFLNEEEISLDKLILHATLHTIAHYNIKGAIDMAVDREDRLYVLTEIGIQCVRSFGLIDVILDLPDGEMPEKIAVTDALYVQTTGGIYKRKLSERCTAVSDEKRRHVHYYD